MRRRQQMFALLLIVIGSSHQALAARQLSPAVSPTSSYTWLPHKNADNVWQPASTEHVDYSKLTLSDLPSPEIFLQMATQSPYPMPDIPMGLLVNNTFNKWSGGKPPSSVQDWLSTLQGAGSFVADSVPTLMAKFLPNITVQGQTVSIAAETSKLLKSLPFFNNSTSVELPLPESMAGVGVAPPVVNLTESLNVTLDILQKLPDMLKKAGEAVVSGVQSLDLSNLQQLLLNGDGQIDIPNILKSALHVDLPQLAAPPNMSQILGDVAKALPNVAQQMGIDTKAVKLPDASAIAGLLQAAKGKDLLVTDDTGRFDLVATLSQLSENLPQLDDVASAVVKALPAGAKGLPKLDQVVSTVSDVSKVLQSVASQLQS